MITQVTMPLGDQVAAACRTYPPLRAEVRFLSDSGTHAVVMHRCANSNEFEAVAGCKPSRCHHVKMFYERELREVHVFFTDSASVHHALRAIARGIRGVMNYRVSEDLALFIARSLVYDKRFAAITRTTGKWSGVPFVVDLSELNHNSHEDRPE